MITVIVLRAARLSRRGSFGLPRHRNRASGQGMKRGVVAHLLVVESWVGSMSRLLPRALQEGGHTFTFLTRDLHHYLRTAPEGAAHPLLGARNVVTADTNAPEPLLPYVERLHEVLGFDGVLTSCDYYPTAALAAERLGLPAPDAEAVRNSCRKDATRRLLDEAGVPGPRFAVHEEGRTGGGRAGHRLPAGGQARRPVRRHVRTAGGRRGAARRSRTGDGRLPGERAGAAAERRCCWRSCWTGRR